MGDTERPKDEARAQAGSDGEKEDGSVEEPAKVTSRADEGTSPEPAALADSRANTSASRHAEEPEDANAPQHADESPPPSATAPQSQASQRRSSLRPAPASFRPSPRDPGQLRPAMVVHAGDVDPSAPRWELPDPAPSQPSQVPLDSVARVEPFALADDANEAEPGTLPLVIPKAGNVPQEALNGAEDSRADDVPVESRHGANNAPALSEPARARRPKKFNANRTAPGIGPLPSTDADARATKALGRNLLLAGAGALLMVGGVVVTMASRSPEAATANSTLAALPETIAPGSVAAAVGSQSAAPSIASAESTPPTPSNSAPVEAASDSTKAEDTASPPNTTRVTLELKPSDAKVIRHGVIYAGPPYVFDVPKGKRIAVEVARPGYVTRRVDIDDKKPLLSIGLIREIRPKSRARAGE